MAGGAAGGFLTRAFESMLKECAGKKYPDFQKSIQKYLDNSKGLNQSQGISSSEAKQAAAATTAGTESTPQTGSEADKGAETDQPSSVQHTSQTKEHGGTSTAGTITSVLATAGHTLEGSDAELILNPLRLAFETQNSRILESALDCLHKLIAYDHFEGDPGLDDGVNCQLSTDILNMVCGCIDNSSPDSTILQVLKVLLTAVASTKFRVHGEPLLGVIRVCYNIALNSKSTINQATSKAMLTQMISIIFRRMETDPVGTTYASSEHDSGGNTEAASAGTLSTIAEETSTGDPDDKAITLADALSQAKDMPLTSVEEIQNLAGGADIKGLEAVLDKAVHHEDGRKITRGIDLESMNIVQRDALLVFRTLCKMGMKEDGDEVTIKTRILSLELLQGLLEGVSHSFTKNFHFIDSVKAYLSYALLRASVSQSPVIFQYATGIFSVLLLRFRESLKGEIGICFPLIVLRSLDGLECPITQKQSVLRMLEKVCKDSQMLVDIFVNYDCDLEAPNLFERMVTSLSKMAQGNQNTDPNSVAATQSTSTKGSSLQCLVSVLKSLVEWENSNREFAKHGRNFQSNHEGVLAAESVEINSRGDVTSDFEKAKAHKSTLEAAISKFNRQPAKGVEFMISNKLVDNKPASVAQFLKNTLNLDKPMIGDYLGQHEEFPLAVMHEYVDSMNFSGMKFETAIREFLNGFRLPGEAQKIDRIMEKFAERFCADNPGLFRSADTAYVFAYAVIMLNTDAHNPMVWPKMSRSDFIRMNAMNNAEESAPAELLGEIYDSIVKEEIKMKDDLQGIERSGREKAEAEEGRLVSILNLALPKRKSAADAKSESEAIVKKMQAMLRKQGVKRGVFYTSKQVELVRPMVEAVGWPLLVTFSVTMEEVDNKPRVILCMEGFKAAVHITHGLGMDTMRYAFLTSLVRFTFLHSPREMRSKNVEALRTLLALCDSYPGALQDTWNAVLECVSRLDCITSIPSISATVMHGSNQISRDTVLQSLRELAGKPSEQVFVNSIHLPSDAIVEFFTALCGVSAEELKQSPARVFSLQKLVEISYYNMARIRMVWARIWSVLAVHLISAGSHHEEKVAMYAIDSLRQLSMKCFERAELANFTFQNDILKPFVVLMRNSRNDSIRQLIVDCIVQMIKSKVGSIKSGWQSVFMIFTAAAADDLESIVENTFENVEQVLLEHFDQVAGDCFMDCVNCLIRFANNKSSHRISLKAIALLRICEDRLAEGHVPGGAMKPINTDGNLNTDVTEHYWFPMLAGLSDLTSDPRPEVRSCALEVLFDLLNERGSKFSQLFWESIFHRILFPIFDQVRHAGKEGFVSSDDEWFRETSIHSLQLLCNLFNTYYKEVCFMLPPLLRLLLDCAKKSDQSVVSIALGALVHLIEVGGHQFSKSDWDTLLKSISDASYTTQPLELLNATSYDNVGNHGAFLQGIVVASNDSVIKSGGNEVVHHHKYNAGENGTTFPLRHTNDESEESGSRMSVDQSEEVPSSSGRASTPAGGLERSQTIGQRIMGNMMDNLLFRNLSSKSRNQALDASTPSSPVKEPEPAESDGKDEQESPLLQTVRGKCITQLLLLGAIGSIQKKYWEKLVAEQKIAVMEILFSFLEFSASYNSHNNLKTRMHQIPNERPPHNLLRQELVATTMYLDTLLKSTSEFNMKKEGKIQVNGFHSAAPKIDNGSTIKELPNTDEKFLKLVEAKLASFCEQALREASDIHSSVGEITDMDTHQVLELRSPVIVKLLKGMCQMNNEIFRRHLREFYPLLTKLLCCDQMDVRGVLADLFRTQLKPLLKG